MSRRAPRGLQATACDETRTAKVVFRSGRLSFQPLVSCESHQIPSTPKLKSVVARSKTLQRVSAPLVFFFKYLKKDTIFYKHTLTDDPTSLIILTIRV